MLIELNTKDIFIIDELTNQILTIKDFPCVIKIHDRLVKVENKNEAKLLYDALQIGWSLKEESIELLDCLVGRL